MTSSSQFTVLVLEDGPLQRTIRTALKGSNFLVEDIYTPEEALSLLHQQQFDLVMLDVEHLRGLALIELCDKIRALAPQSGVLLVVTHNNECDIVHALKAGADDYISKPFRAADLISRCHVMMERARPAPIVDEGTIAAGDLELDVSRRQVRKAGKVVRLTPTEFRMLVLLMKNKGVALTHSELLRAIWGPEYGQELEYLRSYIRLLRKKIETEPSQPEYLLTEPWVGYRFCEPVVSDRTKSNRRTL